jgi:hypothetical protein
LQKTIELIDRMTHSNPTLRPDCQEIIEEKHSLTLKPKDFEIQGLTNLFLNSNIEDKNSTCSIIGISLEFVRPLGYNVYLEITDLKSIFRNFTFILVLSLLSKFRFLKCIPQIPKKGISIILLALLLIIMILDLIISFTVHPTLFLILFLIAILKLVLDLMKITPLQLTAFILQWVFNSILIMVLSNHLLPYFVSHGRNESNDV